MKTNLDNSNNMTVGRLKEILKDVPDDLIVGTADHFGRIVPADDFLWDFGVSKGYPIDTETQRKTETRVEFFNIPVLDIGEEPD